MSTQVAAINDTPTISDTLSKVPAQLWSVTRTFISDLTKLVESPVALDTAFRFVIDSVNLRDLIQRSEKVARPFISALEVTKGVLAPARVFVSLNYFFGGKFLKDISLKDGWTVVSQAAFFIARTVTTIEFFVTHNLLKLDFLANVASKIGQVRGLSLLTKIPKGPFIDAVFVFALVPLARSCILSIMKGEEVAYNLFELASCTADIALCAFAISGIVTSAYILGACSVFAAGTGVVAFFCDPDSTLFKDPFKA